MCFHVLCRAAIRIFRGSSHIYILGPPGLAHTSINTEPTVYVYSGNFIRVTCAFMAAFLCFCFFRIILQNTGDPKKNTCRIKHMTKVYDCIETKVHRRYPEVRVEVGSLVLPHSLCSQRGLCKKQREGAGRERRAQHGPLV